MRLVGSPIGCRVPDTWAAESPTSVGLLVREESLPDQPAGRFAEPARRRRASPDGTESTQARLPTGCCVRTTRTQLLPLLWSGARRGLARAPRTHGFCHDVSRADCSWCLLSATCGSPTRGWHDGVLAGVMTLHCVVLCMVGLVELPPEAAAPGQRGRGCGIARVLVCVLVLFFALRATGRARVRLVSFFF